MKNILMLVVLLLVGCGATSERCGAGDGYTDGTMCESELGAVLTVSSQYAEPWVFDHAVAEHWAPLTAGRVRVSFVVVDGPADFHPDNVICDGRRLAADASPGEAEQAIQHELGHRFGLGHSTDGPALMSAPDPVYGYSHEPSVLDLEHFDRLWELRR